MKRLVKAIVLSTAVFATVAAPVAEAFARGSHHSHRRSHYHHHHRSRGGNAAAAGAIGLAAGAIIGGALTQSQQQPQVIYRTAPPPPPYRVYRQFEPWSPGWYNYCSRKFRSFNPRSGTYRGYDGRDHFCNAP